MSDRDLIERLRSPYVEFDDDRPLAADRLQALSAEVERYRAALRRCGEIVKNNLYRQHEKIEDVPRIVDQALKGANNG
jgi:hypothetical protein